MQRSCVRNTGDGEERDEGKDEGRRLVFSHHQRRRIQNSTVCRSSEAGPVKKNWKIFRRSDRENILRLPFAKTDCPILPYHLNLYNTALSRNYTLHLVHRQKNDKMALRHNCVSLYQTTHAYYSIRFPAITANSGGLQEINVKNESVYKKMNTTNPGLIKSSINIFPRILNELPTNFFKNVFQSTN